MIKMINIILIMFYNAKVDINKYWVNIYYQEHKYE